MAELWIDTREAIIELLKYAKVIEGNNVRPGRRFPFENPYNAELPKSDKMPVLTVSLDRVSFRNVGGSGSRVKYLRQCSFQIDCYLKGDYNTSQVNELNVDEQLNNDLDEKASKICEAIIYYNRFCSENENVPDVMKLRDKVEMYPENYIKNDFPIEGSPIVGVASFAIMAEYQKERNFDELNEFAHIFDKTKQGSKKIEFEGEV